MIAEGSRPDLGAYRRFVVAFSGGKDSLAALLHLLSLGVPPHAIELHHHEIDGGGPSFMDWDQYIERTQKYVKHRQPPSGGEKHLFSIHR